MTSRAQPVPMMTPEYGFSCLRPRRRRLRETAKQLRRSRPYFDVERGGEILVEGLPLSQVMFAFLTCR